MFSAASIKRILERHEINPSKRLGQNFLIDQNILNKIIAAAEIKKDDVILEVGSGLGILTFALALKAKKVIAIEKDKKMCEILENLIKEKEFTNIEIINADILKWKINICHPRESGNDNIYKFISNIPYYLTSPLIRKFLEAKNRPETMILIIQKEVARRICAKPPEMNLLAVSVQYYAEPKIISYVSKNSFWPIPKVDSAIIEIEPKILPEVPPGIFTNKFFQIVRAGFSSPRKQLINNLSKNLKINREKIETAMRNCGLDVKQRAETLSVDDWQKLTYELFKFDR